MAAEGRDDRLAEDRRAAVERGILGFLGRHRTPVQGLIDGLAWSLALSFATLFRYDVDLVGGHYKGLLVLFPLPLCVQGLVGLASGLYTGRSRFGSFEEVMSLVDGPSVGREPGAQFWPSSRPRSGAWPRPPRAQPR